MTPDIDLRGGVGALTFACPNGHWRVTLTPESAAQWTNDGRIAPKCRTCGQVLTVTTRVGDAG